VPRIQFSDVPLEIARHLRRQRRKHKITEAQLQLIIDWILFDNPEAPEGDWYKDFGSFFLCGSGRYPKTVLTHDMKPFGEEID
jgi:hypothetical protein